MEVESLMNEILIACHSTDTELLQIFNVREIATRYEIA